LLLLLLLALDFVLECEGKPKKGKGHRKRGMHGRRHQMRWVRREFRKQAKQWLREEETRKAKPQAPQPAPPPAQDLEKKVDRIEALMKIMVKQLGRHDDAFVAIQEHLAEIDARPLLSQQSFSSHAADFREAMKDMLKGWQVEVDKHVREQIEQMEKKTQQELGNVMQSFALMDATIKDMRTWKEKDEDLKSQIDALEKDFEVKEIKLSALEERVTELEKRLGQSEEQRVRLEVSLSRETGQLTEGLTTLQTEVLSLKKLLEAQTSIVDPGKGSWLPAITNWVVELGKFAASLTPAIIAFKTVATSFI